MIGMDLNSKLNNKMARNGPLDGPEWPFHEYDLIPNPPLLWLFLFSLGINVEINGVRMYMHGWPSG